MLLSISQYQLRSAHPCNQHGHGTQDSHWGKQDTTSAASSAARHCERVLLGDLVPAGKGRSARRGAVQVYAPLMLDMDAAGLEDLVVEIAPKAVLESVGLALLAR